MTKPYVIYDLKKSHHTYTWHAYKFYFSSNYHLEKFKSKLANEVETVNRSLSERFNISIEAELIAIMRLYIKVESRGFYVTNLTSQQMEEYTCPDQVKLGGVKLIRRSWPVL